MCHDRIDGDDIALTHDFMSMMIAAERSGVTVTLHILEGAGMIRSKRGRVIVLDRTKLEEMAGDSYGVPEAEYRRLIGPIGRSPPSSYRPDAGVAVDQAGYPRPSPTVPIPAGEGEA